MADKPLSETVREEDLPQLELGQYPPNAQTEEERRRFRLSLGVAQQLMDEKDGPTVWQMARQIYNNESIPTD